MTKTKFLEGGGEMGELTRNYQWDKTILGKPDNWPQSLQTTVGIILHSAFPMFLFWGDELLCFYNDAYRPSLGNNGKHPLLAKGGKESWPEIWHFIGPLIEKVKTTGEAVYFEDQFLPIYRNGKIEDVYWTFSYSPVYGDDQTIEGVFVTCTETTTKFNALRNLKITHDKIEKSQEELLSYFEQSPVAIATISKENLTFRLVNSFYGELVGRKPDDIRNKPLLEALPELAGQGFDKLLNQVIETGIPFIADDVAVNVRRKGELETIYVNLTYQPQRDANGEVKGVLVVATDVTLHVRSRKKTEESGARLKTMIDQTPAPTLVLMGDDLVVEQINEPMLQMIGHDKEVIGVPLIVTMPELNGQYVWEQVQKVYREGISFDQSEVLVPHARTGIIQDYYYNIAYRPLIENEKIIGMIQVAIDVTEQVLARRKIQENEAHLQLTRDAVPAMIFYLDEEQRYRSYNGVFMKWFDVNATEALGKTTREFIGEAAYAKAGPLLAQAYAGERVEYHMHAPKRIDGEKWLNIVYTPHKISNGKVIGVIVHATDITEHMLALQKIEESEARFRTLLQEAPIAATLFRGSELTIEIANDLTLKYWGKSKNIIGKPLAEAAPELEDQQMIALVKDVYERGGMVSFAETPIRFIEDGVMKDGFYNFSLKALLNSNGEVESVLSTGIDVTEQVNVHKQIEQSEKELRDLISSSPIGICVLSGTEAKIEEVNEQFIIISGKKPEQFINAVYWEVFPEIADAFAPVLENVFKTGIKFTTAEAEMVLIRNGVPETMFATFEYIPIFDNKNKVTKVIVMVVEVTHQIETRREIEEAVVERTKELAESNLHLKRSNEELEQFAYIASHDLQEPVRKISTFMQMLEYSIKENISPKSKDYISKIYSSTDRMKNLIRDVLAFSRIKEETDDFKLVNLNTVVETLKTDYELQIGETETTIVTSELPTLEAVPSQMIQLFGNLMSNSLKYRKQGTNPVIKISASIAKTELIAKRLVLDPNKKYYHIEFSDNGIGFEKEHLERIFKIFQRLHGKNQFEGTGIGLAICRRIVQSHQGHISADIGENGGAVFNIFLPEIQANETLSE